MPKITINNLTFIYMNNKNNTGVCPIFNLSTVIKNNSFSVIIGDSGSGKTTLLKLVAGLLKPHEGQILYDDIDVTNIEANERNISYISQEFSLYPHLTVFDNIAFPLKMGKVPSEEIRIRVKEVLSLLDITAVQARKPKHLSIGERQRVAIARALVKRPSIVLFDEPFSNLDETHKKEMINSLKQIKEEFSVTFIYVTHRLDEIKYVGTDLLILNNGEIVQNDVMDNVLTNSNGYYVKNLARYF